MPKRRNEIEAMIRSEPMAYRAAYDASNNVQYEGWANPGSSEDSAVWIVTKHTYDASNNLTKSEWAQTAGSPAASFDQVWTNRTTLTYV